MSELWTFSGINSPFNPSTGNYEDYTWERLKLQISATPDRRYASHLGTSNAYDREHNVVGLGSEKKLDREADEFVTSGGGYPEVSSGMFKGKTVRVLLVGPKTTTKPPRVSGLVVEVYWSPNDQVPNQRLIRPDTLKYWRKYARGGGQVWPVENKSGSGFGKGHDFNGFLKKPPIVTRGVIRKAGGGSKGLKGTRRVWKKTGQLAPSPAATLQAWIDDPNVDYVLIAHSQGCNIAMHLLKFGY
jgi:hypothetical protein